MGEEQALLELLRDRVPAGVDEPAYVKVGFLTAIANDEIKNRIKYFAVSFLLAEYDTGGNKVQSLSN